MTEKQISIQWVVKNCDPCDAGICMEHKLPLSSKRDLMYHAHADPAIPSLKLAARRNMVQEFVDRSVRVLIETLGDEARWDIAEALAKSAIQTAHGVGLDDADEDK